VETVGNNDQDPYVDPMHQAPDKNPTAGYLPLYCGNGNKCPKVTAAQVHNLGSDSIIAMLENQHLQNIIYISWISSSAGKRTRVLD